MSAMAGRALEIFSVNLIRVIITSADSAMCQRVKCIKMQLWFGFGMTCYGSGSKVSHINSDWKDLEGSKQRPWGSMGFTGKPNGKCNNSLWVSVMATGPRLLRMAMAIS